MTFLAISIPFRSVMLKWIPLLSLALLAISPPSRAYEMEEVPGYVDPLDPNGPGKRHRHPTEQAPAPDREVLDEPIYRHELC